MALSILDGTQTATTLSTILSSGQHITAHTVVSLGTQAITDMRSAVSGSVVSISNFPASQSTTFGAVTGSVSVLNFPSSQTVTFADASLTNTQLRASAVTIGGTVTVGNSLTISSLPAISGTVTANLPVSALNAAGIASDQGGGEPPNGVQLGYYDAFLDYQLVNKTNPLPISGTVTIGSALPAGTNQIGAVTANTFAVQGTAVTTSNFTSITPSTVLASFNATREVLTIFNEGAGNLHICAGATCTTIAYQVRLSSGDYYEVPNHQTSLTHSAVFATAGTARVCQVS
jgi:hypothetical protein